MAVLIIPTSQDLEDYEQQVELEGVTYTFRFRWNGKAEAWFLDILDGSRNPLVLGRRIVVDTLIVEQSRHIDGMFPGRLFAYDTERTQIDPGLTELGSRVVLAYITSDDDLTEDEAA